MLAFGVFRMGCRHYNSCNDDIFIMINKQQHKKSCGPVALFNTLKWKGHNTSYNDIINLGIEKGWFDFKIGMKTQSMLNVLKTFDVEYTVMRNVTLKGIRKNIKSGSSVILVHDVISGGAHATFINKFTKHYMTAWNNQSWPITSTPKLSNKKISSYLRLSKNLHKKTKNWGKTVWPVGIVIH